jgi:outer membrane protein
MKKHLILLFAIANMSMLHAQNDSTMSLQECISYALVHSSSVNNAKLDQYIAKAKVGETRAIGLPQINGELSAVDNPTLKNLFFRGNNNFLKGSPLYTGNPNDVIVLQNILQLRSSADASVTANMLISAAYLVGLKTSKTYAELATKNAQKAEIDVIEAVTKAYYLVLVNKVRMISLNANIARLDTVYNQTKKLNSSGFVEKLDVDRLEVRRLNLLTEQQKFENIMSLSTVLLKFQMGMPIEKEINVEGSIESLKVDMQPKQSITTPNYNQRVEFGLINSQRDMNVQNLKYIKSGYAPSLLAFGTYGYTRSDIKFLNLFNNQWYNYSMVGLKLSVPIFDSFSKVYKAQQARLEIKKSDNNIDNLKLAIDLQTTQSTINYNNSIKTLEAQTKNIKLAREIARVTKVKYQEGVGSNIELVNAEADLKDAETNYYDAAYQTLVAEVEYQKSIGNLKAQQQ